MINRLLQSVLCFPFLLMLPACGPAQSSEQEPSAGPPAGAVSSETAKPALPFPVYQNFSELEPIFQYQNDTTYVINFWATWCKPCIAELPYFEQLHAGRNNRKVKVILVSLDFAKDVETKLATFVKDRQLQPQVIALTDGRYQNWIDKVSPEWGGAIPVTYLYRNQRVLFHDGAFDSYQELEDVVQKLEKG